MENRKDIRKSILNESSYWIEKLNIDLYDALITYQENNNLKKGELAEYLEISKGRLSQILNEGDSNFNTSTLVNILLKLGKFPKIDFVEQEAFLNEETSDVSVPYFIQMKPIGSYSKTRQNPGRPVIKKLYSDKTEMNSINLRNNFSQFQLAK